MQSVLLMAATLACPVGMSVMMWMMMRGHGSTDQIDELRAEIERLKADAATESKSGVGDLGTTRREKPQRHRIWRRVPN
jgi:hypothetical protein